MIELTWTCVPPIAETMLPQTSVEATTSIGPAAADVGAPAATDGELQAATTAQPASTAARANLVIGRATCGSPDDGLHLIIVLIF